MSLISASISWSPSAGARILNLSPTFSPLTRSSRRLNRSQTSLRSIQREKRHAGRDIFPELRSDLIDLRGDRRLDRELVDVGLDRVDARLRLEHVGSSDLTLFLGRPVHGLVIGELGAVLIPPRHFERVRGLVEPLQRRVARAGEVLDAGVGLVGELEVGLGALKRGFLLIDHFRARAHQDVGELGLCDVDAGLGLAPFGDQLRIVDLEQQLPGGDVLAALDGTLAHPPVDPRGDVDAGRIRFALDDERLGPREIPDREADDPGEDERHDRRGRRRAPARPLARAARLWRDLPALGSLSRPSCDARLPPRGLRGADSWRGASAPPLKGRSDPPLFGAAHVARVVGAGGKGLAKRSGQRSSLADRAGRCWLSQGLNCGNFGVRLERTGRARAHLETFDMRSGLCLATMLAASSVAAAEAPLTIDQLLAQGWEIAGYASGYDNRTSLILFRHPA